MIVRKDYFSEKNQVCLTVDLKLIFKSQILGSINAFDIISYRLKGTGRSVIGTQFAFRNSKVNCIQERGSQFIMLLSHL